MPWPVAIFFTPDPHATLDPNSTYTLTARRIVNNETLVRVSATVQVVQPEFYFFGYGTYSIDLKAYTSYQIMVTQKPGRIAPADVVGVPVIGSAKGSAQCSGNGGSVHVTNASATVEAKFPYTASDVLIARASCPPTDQSPPEFNTSASEIFPTNRPIDVNTEVDGDINLHDGASVGSFTASADPSFEIDPSFPYADDFEIDYSPGFDTAVPEPSTWAMLLIGFAGLGFAGYRRSRNAFAL